ncbi:AAA domain-containing protein [Streptacidiphilus sp. MAP5-52]|uniref:AAA domain-containing protein n=1 Tax=Streptacidiphilus sp. MAP5-52 TaxID=3156267 RepID=UPI00351796EC
MRHARDPEVVAATTQLVSFLRELVQTGTRRVRDCRDKSREILWLADLPQDVARPREREDGLVLSLEFVPPAAPPELPPVLDGWVDPAAVADLDRGDPPLAAEGPAVQARPQDPVPTPGELVPRHEAAEQLAAYTAWLARWRRWAEAERVDAPRRSLYEALYAWHQVLAVQDDQRELVLAVGLLSFEDPAGGGVFRHMLTQRLHTAVDRRTARLTVRLAPDGALRVEDQDFLDSDDGWDPERAIAVGEDLQARSPHPLGEAVLEQLAQWQERALARPVAFSAAWEAPGKVSDPVARLTYAPALVLRPRDRNALMRVYEQIGDSIASEGYAPLGMAQMVTLAGDNERRFWTGIAPRPLLGDDPLFPLKTNAQQRQVLRRLEEDTGVVVQGPPGTGKTHTIANLTAALLAEGKRVLVTSARDQPLTVLLHKLPPAVRDLCVLLLSVTSRDGTSELDRTVNTLIDQVAAADPEAVSAAVARLTAERDRLRARIASVTDQIVATRTAETEFHTGVAPGYEGTLAALVTHVRADEDELGWIGILPEQTPPAPPLVPVEAQELLLLLRAGALKEDSPGWLPDESDLLAADETGLLIEAARSADAGLDTSVLRVRDAIASLPSAVADEIALHVEEALKTLHRLGLPDSPNRWPRDHWQTRALTDRLARRETYVWQRVAAVGPDLEQARGLLEATGMSTVVLPDPLTQDRAASLLHSAEELRVFLRDGGKIRPRFPFAVQKRTQQILQVCSVDGCAPQSVDALETLIAHVKAHQGVLVATARWNAAGVTWPAADSHTQLARLVEHHEQLDAIDAFALARESADSLLDRHGLRIPLNTPEEWHHLVEAVHGLGRHREAKAADRVLATREGELRAHATPAPAALALADALRDRDTNAYAAALQALMDARDAASSRRRCVELLTTLQQAHPTLADQLSREPGNPAWEQRLTRLGPAFAWAAASRFLAQQPAVGLDHRLQAELQQLDQRLEIVTGDLAAARARAHLVARITPEQRSALQAYRSHTTSVGKGTGRHAGLYRAAARDAMNVARDAVPAWVMPIAQVAENLQAHRDAFDVVIVDEASQASIDNLFLLWLAPRVIVVGDDKQCTPLPNALGPLQIVQDRLTAYLPDLPPRLRQLYTAHSNLYGLLTNFFPKVIRLTEHFRCMPEIIKWSSDEFYDKSLIPLRQFAGDRLPPLAAHYVSDAVTAGRDGRIHNVREAEALVDHLATLIEDPAYSDRTFGVIVLQGHQQVRIIEQLINAKIPATARQRHALRVDVPAGFQGDERDVILLSMVVTSPNRIWGGNLGEQQRYNVAASRARDQMHLFHSVPRHRLKTDDLRLKLLAHIEDPGSAYDGQDLGPVHPDRPHRAFDSLFEQRVYLAITARGYRVVPQLPAGGKRIDLVVIGSHERLAVECDGDYYHSDPEEIRKDHQRERDLERVGWQFWRVRDSEFRRDSEAALASLWPLLQSLGIQPKTTDQDPHATATTTGASQ